MREDKPPLEEMANHEERFNRPAWVTGCNQDITEAAARKLGYECQNYLFISYHTPVGSFELNPQLRADKIMIKIVWSRIGTQKIEQTKNKYINQLPQENGITWKQQQELIKIGPRMGHISISWHHHLGHTDNGKQTWAPWICVSIVIPEPTQLVIAGFRIIIQELLSIMQKHIQKHSKFMSKHTLNQFLLC